VRSRLRGDHPELILVTKQKFEHIWEK
jgi:hypothetical protein